MGGKIFLIMGKSSSGKDSLYNALMHSCHVSLSKVIPYTTRPIRFGEKNGENYFFCNDEEFEIIANSYRIIEIRQYFTVNGIWKYFTIDDGQIDLNSDKNYLMIGTLDSYHSIRSYYGSQNVIPLYIEVEDGERIIRAINREKKQLIPQYAEVCRRFLADMIDFSEEKLENAGIKKRFNNNESIETTTKRLEQYILSILA